MGGTTWTAGSFNSKNQVADPNWVYDNAGNVVAAGTGGPTLQYDAENRLVKACGSSSCTTFGYDAAGNRVQRTDSSSQSSATTTFVYDAFGNLAADYGAPSNVTGTQYVTVDALGSTRLVMNGTAVERHDFEPYGTELSGGWRTSALGYSSATVRQRFTGQERDDETTLDYFMARYYSGTQGRFGSPDPGNAGANPGDPQSWNGYAYVSGNPLTYTDPSGLLAEAGGGGDSGGGWGGVIVAGFEFLGQELADLLGGGSKPDLSSVAWTPGPVQPLTGGSFASLNLGGQGGPLGAELDTSVLVIPGLIFTAQATAKADLSAKSGRQIANCAADFGNKYSVAAGLEAVTGGRVSRNNTVVSTLLGNDVSSISDIFTGRDGLSAGISEFFSNPSSWNVVAFGTRVAGSLPSLDFHGQQFT